jgi:NAD(P)-dependent dehydrogenase (short-subunit alcohol dehydrogenase family)
MFSGGSDARSAILLIIAVAITAMLSTVRTSPHTGMGTSIWDDSVLKDLARFYRQQLFHLHDETTGTNSRNNVTSSPPLDGIVILVTGSTSGIGRSLVRWTYKEGATVLAMGRSRAKLEKLRSELVEPHHLSRQEDATDFGSSDCSKSAETEGSECNIGIEMEDIPSTRQEFFPIVADMSDLNSVSTAVDTIRSTLSPTTIRRIDIVVCNAGIWVSNDAVSTAISTEQGHDLTFGVNYLSHFLLTEKLMRTRRAGGGPDRIPTMDDEDQYLLSPKTSRVVQVSSTFNMGVDGTALSAVSHEEYKTSNINKGTKNDKIEEDENGVEAFTRTSHSPPASRVPSACSNNDEGLILNFLQSWFRSQRQYANSKLAQLLHARISNRKFFVFLESIGSASKARVYVPFVSACPGWVGTHILRATIEYKSWQERLFNAFAFDVDGYGLSSILKAMFDPLLLDLYDNKDNDNRRGLSIENIDYFPNICGIVVWTMCVGERILVLLESMSTNFLGTTYINGVMKYSRDIISTIGSSITFAAQHFFTTPDIIPSNKHARLVSQELFRYKSSTASYNRTLQHDLYEWSLKAVADYL